FFSSRRRHTRFSRDWSSDVCSSDLSSVGAEMKLAPGIELDVQTYFNWMDPVLFDLEVNGNPDDLLSEGPGSFPGLPGETPDRPRSEERRVGKECRSRRSALPYVAKA